MSEKKVRVSIIIPLPRFNDYIREAIPYYEKLDFDSYEIIILPDGEETEKLSDKLPLRVVPSGKVGPAEKRDMGAQIAKGDILAFTDDDAYPDPAWLKEAVRLFDDPAVGAVGGPAITPPDEKFWQKVSGNVYASIMTSGAYRKRYIITGTVHEDYDLPSVNLIVRREVFNAAGGFDSTFYPGEDTKLCLEIKRAGHKILYNPASFVYHHRRNLFPKHFEQIANYALHRGYFVHKYPETSRNIAYFLPSIFTAGLFTGPLLSLLYPPLWYFYSGVLAFYFALAVIVNIQKNAAETFWTVVGVFLSHITYGFHFIKGLFFTRNLVR